jgi:uncharacterized protein (DUF697 family)
MIGKIDHNSRERTGKMLKKIAAVLVGATLLSAPLVVAGATAASAAPAAPAVTSATAKATKPGINSVKKVKKAKKQQMKRVKTPVKQPVTQGTSKPPTT